MSVVARTVTGMQRPCTLDDVRLVAADLPGAAERVRPSGVSWFVRSKLFAWEVHPWPSIPADMRAIIASEPVFAVKVADRVDALALVEMAPETFLRTTTAWCEPKVAFRLAAIDRDHLRELVTEAWWTEAPRALRRAFDEAG